MGGIVSLGVADFALFDGVMVFAGWVCCNTGSADLAMFGGFAGFGQLVVVVGFWCCGDAGFVGFWWVLL